MNEPRAWLTLVSIVATMASAGCTSTAPPPPESSDFGAQYRRTMSGLQGCLEDLIFWGITMPVGGSGIEGFRDICNGGGADAQRDPAAVQSKEFTKGTAPK